MAAFTHLRLLTIQHDAQLDFYGKRLATCSSDKTIRIFNVVKGEAKGDPVILKGQVRICSMNPI